MKYRIVKETQKSGRVTEQRYFVQYKPWWAFWWWDTFTYNSVQESLEPMEFKTWDAAKEYIVDKVEQKDGVKRFVVGVWKVNKNGNIVTANEENRRIK